MKSNKPTSAKERGIALIITMMVVTVMTVLIMDLHQSVRIHFYIATNLVDGVKAAYLVRSGVQVAAGALLSDRQDNSDDHMHESWYDFMGLLNMYGLAGLPVGEGTVLIDIKDEAGRFNLNSMINKRGKSRQQPIEIFKKLLLQLELEEALANSIVDWIDADEEAIEGGGLEDQVYGYEAMGIVSKNAPFDSLEEVRLVFGMNDEVWAKLSKLISIYGDVRMNLNTAPKEVIKAVIRYLDESADTGVVDKIIEWREMTVGEGEDEEADPFASLSFTQEGNYFKKKDMIKTLTAEEIGMDRTLARRFTRYFKSSSRYFRINCTAIVGGVQKSAVGVTQRSKKKAKIIYYRVSPGAAPDFMQEEEGSVLGEEAPTPDVQGMLQSLGM